MGEVLILEDNKENIELLRLQIQLKAPKGLVYTILGTSQELREYLEQGRDADLYFLDNMVPSVPGKKPVCQFHENYLFLIQARPHPKIFYTGSNIDADGREFCIRNEVRVIKKENIADVINEEIS